MNMPINTIDEAESFLRTVQAIFSAVHSGSAAAVMRILADEIDAAHRRGLESAARIAEADLAGVPGVIVPECDRADNGSSAATAKRIAAAIRAQGGK